MKEYALFVASALASAVVNTLGALRGRGRGPERILVVKLDHVGDLILATPALRALRDANPDAVIDVLVSPESAFVLAGNPAVTRTIVYDSPLFHRGPAPNPPSPPLRDVVRDRYTAIVELRGDWSTLALPFRTGAARRVDRGTVRLRDWLARHVPWSDDDRPPLHEVGVNLEIVGSLLGGRRVDPNRAHVEIYSSAEARESALARLRSAGGDPERPIVCIHPGASRPAKAWSAERFAAVADWIPGHYHAQVVFLGSKAEKETEAAVRAATKGRENIWLTGELTLDEVAALLGIAKLFLGNDGGPAHLAAAAGTSSVVLFGPTDPERFGPWSERAITLRRGVRPGKCRVNDIEVDQVTSAIASLLDMPARAAELRSR